MLTKGVYWTEGDTPDGGAVKVGTVTGIFWVGLALRLVLVGVGVVVDHWAERGYLSVRYTDVDYHVFTDAALLLSKGSSPYDKFSYRYPPVLAALLVPIHFLAFPAFGKVLFCLVDAAAVFPIFDICRLREGEGEGQRRHLLWSWIWALNPLSSVICSRGSADSLVNLVVLVTVQLALRCRLALSGACLGLAIYLRLYPVIYVPAFAVHLYCSRGGVRAAARFMFAAVICGSVCVGLSWLACGQRYWDEAVAFHVWRKDHRHNFSPHFYSTYLHKSEASQAEKGTGSVVVTVSSLSSMLLPFCPQLLLLAATATSLAPRELEMCLLVQTLIFVAFNKVSPGQLFFLILIKARSDKAFTFPPPASPPPQPAGLHSPVLHVVPLSPAARHGPHRPRGAPSRRGPCGLGMCPGCVVVRPLAVARTPPRDAGAQLLSLCLGRLARPACRAVCPGCSLHSSSPEDLSRQINTLST